MFDECIYFNLVTLTRRVSKTWQEEFERLGLSPSHGYLLFAIAENPKASQKDLGELMELDASTITRFVDALAAKGLVEKKSRGKGAVIAMTPEGRKTHRAVQAAMDRLYGAMAGHFGEKRFTAFVGDLRAARESFTEN